MARASAAKVNANIPSNPATRGLPTIQGVLVLFDATSGVPLAVMDSASITTLRTAAASALAAKYLARTDASALAFIGCGAQARTHLIAISHVRTVRRVRAADARAAAAEAFCQFARDQCGLNADVASSVRDAARGSDIIVTSTPSTRASVTCVRASLDQLVAGTRDGRTNRNERIVFDSTGVAIEDVAAAALVFERSQG